MSGLDCISLYVSLQTLMNVRRMRTPVVPMLDATTKTLATSVPVSLARPETPTVRPAATVSIVQIHTCCPNFG